jgi:hypothetical protein
MRGEGPAVDRTQLVDCDRELPLNLELARTFVRDPDTQNGNVATVAEASELDVVFAGDGNEGTGLGFRKQGGGCIDPVTRDDLVNPDAGTDSESQDAVGNCTDESTGSEVDSAGDDSFVCGGTEKPGEVFFRGEINPRRDSTEVVVHGTGPRRSAQLVCCDTQQIKVLAVVLPT